MQDKGSLQASDVTALLPRFDRHVCLTPLQSTRAGGSPSLPCWFSLAGTEKAREILCLLLGCFFRTDAS